MGKSTKEGFRSPMLAGKFDESVAAFPIYASPKLDGIRAVIEFDANMTPTVYSRSGIPIPNRYIQGCLRNTRYIGFDGEICVGSPNAPDVYNRTMSGAMSEDGEPNFNFYVFDHRSYPDAKYLHRLALIQTLIRDFSIAGDRVRVLEQVPILDQLALDSQEQKYLSDGYEGMMVRRGDLKYKFGRSTTKSGELLKVKRFEHSEAKIIGFKEAMSNQNIAETDALGRVKRSSARAGLVAANYLGAFVCESGEYQETFDVSAGSMSLNERIDVWANRVSYLHKIIRFKHLPHGAKNRPRHALYAGLRDPIDIS